MHHEDDQNREINVKRLAARDRQPGAAGLQGRECARRAIPPWHILYTVCSRLAFCIIVGSQPTNFGIVYGIITYKSRALYLGLLLHSIR